ncbi:unnamed protein product [Diplocarpon coronariae]
MIHAVDPILHLQHHAPVLLNDPLPGRVPNQPLRLLQRHAAVLARAAVHLQRVLVRVHVQPDAAPGRGERGYWGLGPAVGEGRGGPGGQEAGVVASTVGAAVAEEGRVGKVGANLFGRRPEVVEAVLGVGEDVAGGDEDRIGGYALAAKGEVAGGVSLCLEGGLEVQVQVGNGWRDGVGL